MFCNNWLHLFHLVLCCSFEATPWHAYAPSWQVILSYTVWICAAAIVSITVNSLRSSHGKANRLSFCHIPFRSEGSFWQECCCPARWLKGSFSSVSAVDLSTQTFTHTQVSTRALRKKNAYSHYVKLLCTLYMETYSLFLVQNFKHLENHCVMFEEWFSESVWSVMMLCTFQGYARSHLPLPVNV